MLILRLIYISSYGECCVDDVNASHLSANDMIVHFGRFCLSTASNKNKDKEIVYVLPIGDDDKGDWQESFV